MEFICIKKIINKITELVKTRTVENGNLWDEGYRTAMEEMNEFIISEQKETAHLCISQEVFEKHIEKFAKDSQLPYNDIVDSLEYLAAHFKRVAAL